MIHAQSHPLPVGSSAVYAGLMCSDSQGGSRCTPNLWVFKTLLSHDKSFSKESRVFMTEQRLPHSQLEQIADLVHHLEHVKDEGSREIAMELMQHIMELHRSALERLLEIVDQQIAPHRSAILRLADDSVVSGLLLLHGLHPIDLSVRVNGALEKVRPYLKSHGGNVELIGIDTEGGVTLRLQGSCHGCPSSAMTLKSAIEEVIYEFAPDVARLEVEGVVPPHPADFIAVESLGLTQSKDTSALTGWEEVADVDRIGEGGMELREVGDRHVLLLRALGQLYAYENTCGQCARPLDSGRFETNLLTCPACGSRFDVVHAGRCLNMPALHLEPLPLLITGGRTRVTWGVST